MARRFMQETKLKIRLYRAHCIGISIISISEYTMFLPLRNLHVVRGACFAIGYLK